MNEPPKTTAQLLEELAAMRQRITELEEHNAALNEDNTMFRILVDAIPYPIYAKDTKSRFLMVNETVVRNTGIASSEMLGKTDYDFFPKEIADEFFADEQTILATCQSLFEKIETWANMFGREGWYLTSKFPFYDNQGNLKGIVGIGRDITEQHEAEQALINSEERYRITSELISDYAYALDIAPDGSTHTTWITEDSFKRLTGYNWSEIPLESYLLFHPDDITIIQKSREETLQGKSVEEEYRIITRSGEIRWVHHRRQPVWDPEQKRVIRVYGVTQDITKRKQAEQAREENERRYKGLFEQTNDAVYVIGLDDMFITANQRGADMLGYAVDELVGQSVELVAPNDKHEHRLAIQKALIAGETIPVYEHVFRKKNGEEFLVEVNVTLVKDPNGQPRHIQSVVRDITTRKQAEQQHLDLALEKERSDTLRMLIGNISHDIKTPLSIINTSLYLLEKLTVPQKRQEKIDSIKGQVRILENFIQDLLALSRLDSNPTMRMAPVDVNELMLDIEAETQPMIEQKRITFTLDLAEDLLPIRADQADLRRALTNLVENALHYTPAGQTVTVRTRRQANEALVEVVDTGIGINEVDLPYIFDRFYRSPQAQKLITTGSGLGLAIVQRVIRMHEGSIDVMSQPGTGTTFRIRLPLY